MKRIAISGSWRNVNAQVERDVRASVYKIMRIGDAIVTGGAPGVDYFAVDEALKQDPTAVRISVILPTTLKFYLRHTILRMEEGLIPKEKGEPVVRQLEELAKASPRSIIEGKDIPGEVYVRREQHFAHNSLIVDAADELIAFIVNGSEGTADAIEKAKMKGIPVEVHTYTI